MTKATTTIRTTLCGLLLAGFGLPAMAQVKVGDNPNQIVPGARLQVDGDNTTATPAKLIVNGSGNVGVGTAAPGTALDVNGAITNRETATAVTGNAATIAANVSQVQLTGAATANIAVTAPVAPNAGQRLIIYNNTTGGFPAVLNSIPVPMGQALEFVYSAGSWRATNGGAAAVAANTHWQTLGNTGTASGTNFIGTTDNISFVTRTNNVERMRVDSLGNVGIGTATPHALLQLRNGGVTRKLVLHEDANDGHSFYGFGVDPIGSIHYQISQNTVPGIAHIFYAAASATSDVELMRITGTGNVGIGAAAPGTALDVNGAITNRETAVAVATNAATVPANVSQVQLTGAATANIAVTAPAAPNAGQRLIVYNNTTGGFPAVLNGIPVPMGQALEFVYSASGWRATNGGAAAVAANTNWQTLGNTGTASGTHFIGTTDNVSFVTRTNNVERMRVDSLGNVGVGNTAPAVNLEIGNGGSNSANPVLRLHSSGNAFGSGGVLQFRESDAGYGTNVRHQTGSTGNAVEGLYFNSLSNNVESTTPTLMLDQLNQRVGIGTAAPGTALDVNGAITNRETAVAVTGNAATIAANVSQVQLTGAATANVVVTAPAAPNAGQRLIIYNNTTGGFNATLGTATIVNGQAVEFVYSNGAWRTTDNGVNTVGAPNDWHITGNAGSNPSNHFIGTSDNTDFVTRTNNTEKMRVTAAGNVGIANTAPNVNLAIGSATASIDNPTIRLHSSNGSTYAAGGVIQFREADVNWGTNIRHRTADGTGGVEGLYFYSTNNTGENSVPTLMLDQVNRRVGMGTGTPDQLLSVNGNASKAAGGTAWAVFSDKRLKKDIHPFTDGLQQVLQINPVFFKYNGKGDLKASEKDEVGIIAQDMQKIAPYTVTETSRMVDSTGKGVLQFDKADAVTYMLVNAVKEQQAMIEKQQQQIQQQQEQIAKMAGLVEQTATRSERLEQQNNQLSAEVKALKQEAVPGKYVAK